MEKEILERFIEKKIVFRKSNSDINFIGILKEVTDSSIILDFHGGLQAHIISDIVEMREAYNDREGNYG
jgi:ferredoxin-fold anticodon binding domain-containing protein